MLMFKNFFKRLFSMPTVSSIDLKAKLKVAERQRNAGLRRLDAERATSETLFDRLVEAREEGDTVAFQMVYGQYRQRQEKVKLLEREIHESNLAITVLQRAVRAVEESEQKGSGKVNLRQALGVARDANIETALQSVVAEQEELREEARDFLEVTDEILEEAPAFTPETDGAMKSLMEDIDMLIDAKSAGDLSRLEEERKRAKDRLDEDRN
jgi:predicted HicB family RNase H-like nuclease